MPGKKPTLSENHFGSLARYDWVREDRTLTMEQALFNRETELGRELDRQERRDFMRGWRAGLVVQSANELISLSRYLRKDDLEALGEEVFALLQKYGGGRTIAEMEAELDDDD